MRGNHFFFAAFLDPFGAPTASGETETVAQRLAGIGGVRADTLIREALARLG